MLANIAWPLLLMCGGYPRFIWLQALCTCFPWRFFAAPKVHLMAAYQQWTFRSRLQSNRLLCKFQLLSSDPLDFPVGVHTKSTLLLQYLVYSLHKVEGRELAVLYLHMTSSFPSHLILLLPPRVFPLCYRFLSIRLLLQLRLKSEFSQYSALRY